MVAVEIHDLNKFRRNDIFYIICNCKIRVKKSSTEKSGLKNMPDKGQSMHSYLFNEAFLFLSEAFALLNRAFGLLKETFASSKIPFGVSKEAFGVSKIPFSLSKEAFGLSKIPFGVLKEAFGVSKISFGVLKETFGVSKIPKCFLKISLKSSPDNEIVVFNPVGWTVFKDVTVAEIPD